MESIEKYGKLTVLNKYRDGKETFANVKCDCGTEKVVRYWLMRIKKNPTKSCGCSFKDAGQRAKELGTSKGENNGRFLHGGKGSRLYNIWKDMRKRCKNPNATNFPHYGGKGISVCSEWNDFLAFRDWSEINGYDESLKIDRIDSTGNYEPTNCRWATALIQHRNQSNNRHIEYKGQVMTVSQASQEYNVCYSTLISRLDKGWTIDRALTEKTFGRKIQS